MKEYHKINTIFKRDPITNKIIIGDYSCEEFRYLANNIWEWSEKVDGTNIRIMWNGKDIVFGGKTDDAQMPVFLMYILQELFEGNKKELFKSKFVNKDGTLMDSVCLYGEGYGAKIQKGGGNYIKDGVDFVLFDVKIGETWLERENVEDIANHFGLKIVPIIGEGTLSNAVEKVKVGFNSQWGDFIAEGIVLRPKTELRTRRGDRVITKIKYRDFL